MLCFGESGRRRLIKCETVRHKIENKRRLDLDRWTVRESFRLVIGISMREKSNHEKLCVRKIQGIRNDYDAPIWL